MQGTQAVADSLAPWLETGCGGGVTGAGGGTFVTTRGDFYRYQRAGPAPRSPRTLTFVRRDSARAAVLVDAAVREGITRVRYVKPYNMTCHLSLAARDTSYEVAWPMDTSPEPIRKLVAIAKGLDIALIFGQGDGLSGNAQVAPSDTAVLEDAGNRLPRNRGRNDDAEATDCRGCGHTKQCA